MRKVFSISARVHDQLDAAPATARRCLEQKRIADRFRQPRRFLGIARFVRAGHQRHAAARAILRASSLSPMRVMFSALGPTKVILLSAQA